MIKYYERGITKFNEYNFLTNSVIKGRNVQDPILVEYNVNPVLKMLKFIIDMYALHKKFKYVHTSYVKR